MVMLLNSRPAPPGSLMASCRPPPSASISSMKKRTGLRPAQTLPGYLSSRANPAGQQLRSGYVFEVQPELASGRSRQKCFPCPTRSVQKDSISHQPVAFVFFWMQMSLHYLSNLFLCLFHAAEIAEPFRWYIANDFDRFWCCSLSWPANSRSEEHTSELQSLRHL